MSNVNTIIGGSTLLDHHGPNASLRGPEENSYGVASVDVELQRHEETILEDHVVTSDDDSPDKIALAVALVQSVVETNHSKKKVNGHGVLSDSKTSKSKKRRRPTKKGSSNKQLLNGSGRGDSRENIDSLSSTCDTLPQKPRESQAPERLAISPLPPLTKSAHCAGPLPMLPLKVATESVPSPLPNPTVLTTSLHHRKPPSMQLSENSTVPNPLSNPFQIISTSAIDSAADSDHNRQCFLGSKSSTFLVNVPCPLPVSTFDNAGHQSVSHPAESVISLPADFGVDKRKVTISSGINEACQTKGRGRVFSIDLDPSFLDSMVIAQETASNPGESVVGGESTTNSRGRAFSFECFAFGINADEPLPPLQEQAQDHYSHVTIPTSRPRGDSIIFDPVSFQDGGIHEKTASLMANSRSRGLSTDLDEAALFVVSASDNDMPPLTQSSMVHSSTDVINHNHRHNTLTILAPPRAIKVETLLSSSGSTLTTLPSSLSATITATAATGATATFSMELLNKGGRIGIYLPDARKARIARFHAKRKMRIWRKRIKYDCRKKLADSRPRIKGRFVKRSDMGED